MNNFTTNKLTIDILKVGPNPWNPNEQSEETFRKEVESIRQLGLLGAILARKINHTTFEYQILDGEHRWKACKELGYTEIQLEVIDDCDDKKAQMLTILLNNLRGKDDVLKRAKILEVLDSGQLQLLPFSQADIDNEKKLLTFDFSQYDEQREASAKKVADKAVLVGLTSDERDMWKLAVGIAKDKEGKDERELFMGMLKFYLQLRAKEIPEYLTVIF